MPAATKEIVKMYGGDHRVMAPLTPKDVERWYLRVRDAFLGWAIELAGECIGTVTLHDYDEHNRCARFSIGLLSPENLGRLEFPGDAVRSVQALQKVVRRIQDFLALSLARQ